MCIRDRAQGDLAAGRQPRSVALALVLAALVNTKQSGIGLLAALAGAAAVAAWAERTVPRAAARRYIAVTALPAIGLYLVWCGYVSHAGIAELQPLAFSKWNWPTLPATFASALAVVVEKPVYFACVAAAFFALAVSRYRLGWTPASRMLTLHAALFTLYNAFLVLTYLGHFPREMSIEAHSFFRYNTHLSLVLVLALAMAASELGIGAWLMRGHSRLAAAAAVALVLLAPIGFIGRLRFDLDMPQPLAWDLAKHLTGYLHDGDRLALLLPGDNDSVATMIAGVLADTTPRRKGLDLLRRSTADLATLNEAARLGYPLALISCTSAAGLPPGVPPSQAVLLRYEADAWHQVAAWPYPAHAAEVRWQRILAWDPLCRHS